jgi:hypothetical protein
MAMVLSASREREAGACSGRHDRAAVEAAVRHHLHYCCFLAMLMCALARAEEGAPDSSAILGWDRGEASLMVLVATLDTPARHNPQSPVSPAEYSAPPQAYDTRVPVPAVAGPGADDDAPGLSAVDREAASTRNGPRRVVLHLDDITSATGFMDSRIRSMALALDAVVPHAGGLTIQPRVQMAYQPGTPAAQGTQPTDIPGDTNSTGVGVRLYGAQPTRLAGIYPFVEADWWQDSRKQTLNINGTKIDTDLLRGLFSFNIGAHGNTSTGMKLWFKVKAGHNPGGTVGARYRW